MSTKFIKSSIRLFSEKNIIYTKNENWWNWCNDGHIYRIKKIDEIQEILIAERDKRNELSTKYNRGVNILGVIDNCLGVTAIGLCITGVGLLSTIVAAPAVIGMEAVSIVMGLIRVVGNHAIKKMSLKIEKMKR